MQSEGFYVNEKSTEPATYRFVAQHLNHCATAVPTLICREYYLLSNLLEEEEEEEEEEEPKFCHSGDRAS